MEKQIHIIKTYFRITVLLITIMSSTFLLMPIANYIESGWRQRVVLVIVGILFWSSLIGGYTFLIMAQKMYKRSVQKDVVEKEENDKLPGCLKFFSNTFSTIADMILIAAVAITIVFSIFGRMHGFLPYIVLAILIFSINMHCLFNGNIYKFITNNDMRRERDAKEYEG